MEKWVGGAGVADRGFGVAPALPLLAPVSVPALQPTHPSWNLEILMMRLVTPVQPAQHLPHRVFSFLLSLALFAPARLEPLELLLAVSL